MSMRTRIVIVMILIVFVIAAISYYLGAFSISRSLLAPLNETMAARVKIDLLFSSLIFLCMGALVAAVLSKPLTRPYHSLEELNKTLEQRDILLSTGYKTAEMLLDIEDDADIETQLLNSMEVVGRAADLDRVHIWRSEVIDGMLYFIHINQWLSDFGRERTPMPVGMKITNRRKPEWKEMFFRGEYINGPLSGMSQEDQEFFKTFDLKSIVLIPLFLQERIWGFFSLDDCRRERTFTEDEINILRSVSMLMASAIHRSVQAAKLHEAHERAKALLDATPFGTNLWSRDGVVFDCNDESVKLFGLSSKEEYLKRFFDLSPVYQPDGQLSTEKASICIQKAFIEGRCACEWMHQTLDGAPIPAEAILVRVPYGESFAVAGYTRDLREHNTMMREIEQRDNLLSIVNQTANILLQSESSEFQDDVRRCMGMIGEAVNANRVCIWENHTKDGKLCCTQIYEWVYDVEPQNNSEISIDVVYEEQLPGWQEVLSRNECINNIVSFMSPDEQAQLAPQGIVSLFVVPIFIGNHFWGFIGFDNCHDEQLYTKNEQAILRSGGLLIANALLQNDMMSNIRSTAAKLEAVISNYAGIIWNVDRNNVITLLNGLYLKRLGLTPASFEGWDLEAAQQNNGRLKIIMNVQKTFTEGSQDWVYDDHDKIFRAHNTPIFDDNDEVTSVVGTIDDITELNRLQTELEKALQEAQTANNAKSDFLAKMSHEMRTPLNAVIGLTGLSLEDETLNTDARAIIEKVYDAGVTLLSIVNDILDISKIESGKLELVEVDYDVPSLINDTVTQNILRIGEKPIDFKLNINGDMFSRLHGDELRVKQIMNNLLSNAIKYTAEGYVELGFLCTLEIDTDTVWLTITVRDTGRGIRSEDLEKLFYDYSQLDLESSRNIEGTGLGLPITKRLAEMMDGSIDFESEYGKGSVFTVTVAQRFVADTYISGEVVDSLKNFRYSNEKRDRNTKITRIYMPYARVLVVDDNLTNLEVAKGLMEPYKMQIDCVTGGQEAVDVIRAEKVRYDAIFMDHMMPVVDGIEATKLIRETGTNYAAYIPIIALTANAVAGSEQMFLSKGFQAFLSKPIDLLRLDEIIRRFVRDKEKEKMYESEDIKIETINIPGGMLPDKVIAGLHIRKGIERFGGNENAYLEVLRSYAANTRQLLGMLKDVGRNDLADYATTVHGIKGSSRGICADITGDLAEDLEKAAKAGDFAYVRENNVILLYSVKRLIAGIEDLLSAIDAKNRKPVKEQPEIEMLKKLYTACEDYNMDAAEAVISEINNYKYEADGGLADWLSENVKLTNFKQIIEKLTGINML